MKALRTSLTTRLFRAVRIVAFAAAGMSTAAASVTEAQNGIATEAANIHSTFSGDPQTEVTVSWRTLKPMDRPRAKFAAGRGEWSERDGISISSAGGFNHHVKLAGLRPGLRYAYQVAVPGGGWGPVCHFRTVPPDGAAFTFAVIGDVQGKDQPSEAWRKAGEFLAAREDVVCSVLLGDLVDSGGDQRHWDAFFNPSVAGGGGALFHAMAVLPVPGNHDYYAPTPEGEPTYAGIRLFLDQFRLPPNGKYDEWNGRFYSLDFGPARLVMLDSEGAPETRVRMQVEQTDWLGDLDLASKTWNLAFLHRPVHPFLRHTPSAEASGIWRPHFFDRSFSLVFNGHNHAHAVSAKLRTASLAGRAGGLGFEGPWERDASRNDAGRLTPLLLLEAGAAVDYAGCESSGRAVCTRTQGSFDTRPIHMRRAITPLDTRVRNELWMGFLYRKNGGWYAAGQGGFRLSAAGAPSVGLQVDTTRTEAETGGSGRFRVSIGEAHAVSRARIAVEGRETIPREPFFVLAKFVFEAAATKGYLRQYQSPEPLPDEAPEEWDAVVDVPGSAAAVFDTLVLLGEDPQRESLVDELRIGGSAAAVVPPRVGMRRIEAPWVEERFDPADAGASGEGVVYYDAGGINHSGPPADFWYIRHRQEAGMKLVGLVEVDPGYLKVQTVFFDDFGDRKAGEVLHEFTLTPEPRSPAPERPRVGAPAVAE